MSAGPRPRVLLLAGMTSDGPSMTRYARELFAALAVDSSHPYAIHIEHPPGGRYLARVIDRSFTHRVDNAWLRYIAYPRAIRRRAPDAWHILDHSYAHLIRQTTPYRTVVTCHDVIPLLAAERVIAMDIPATVVRTFRMRMRHMARAHTVITASHATKATLERYTDVPRDRIVVIPYGLNPAFSPRPGMRSATRRSVGLDDHAPVLLQVATTARYKNTPVVLQTLAEIRARIPETVLLRVGAPLFDDETRLAERLGVAAAIIHVGDIRDDRGLAAWYTAADVLVFPSLWEGFGWPPIEAMACGTPVVASTAPAISEVVGDAGLLVPAEDASAVAAAVERVLSDAALAATLRGKGAARARQYRWERAARETAAAYARVLE